MGLFSISNVRFRGVAATVPHKKALNQELTFLTSREKEQLIKQVGIKERRIAPKGMTASDLCYKAAENLLADLGWSPSQVDFLIFVSQTPDFTVPGSSMTLQDRLSLSKSCMALDINQGCAGYVYGLATLSSLISSSGGGRGLLLVGDTITHLIDENDKTLLPIFSDAGSCTALEFESNAEDVHFNLMTDGSRYDAIIVKNKGGDVSGCGNDQLEMKGHEIFKFGLEDISPNVKTLIKYSDKSIDEFDYFIMHQANQLLNEAIRKKVGIERGKVPSSLRHFGNTSSATIPITMVTEIQNEIRSQHLQHLFCGFGVGLSWGTASISTNKIVCPDLIEMQPT